MGSPEYTASMIGFEGAPNKRTSDAMIAVVPPLPKELIKNQKTLGTFLDKVREPTGSLSVFFDEVYNNDRGQTIFDFFVESGGVETDEGRVGEHREYCDGLVSRIGALANALYGR